MVGVRLVTLHYVFIASDHADWGALRTCLYLFPSATCLVDGFACAKIKKALGMGFSSECVGDIDEFNSHVLFIIISWIDHDLYFFLVAMSST